MKDTPMRHHPPLSAASFAVAAICLSPAANAQSSVALYGILDAGFVVADRGHGVKITQVSSGILSGSRWGVRGVEDLGAGLKALFALETGLDLDTGTLKAFSPQPSSATPTAPNGAVFTGGFNRRSFVGLDTPIGEFHFGRDYAPFFHAVLKADTMSLGLFGNLQSSVSITGSSERWVRFSNGVNYLSPNLGGLRVRAAYSFGENTGAPGTAPKGASNAWGLGAEYSMGDLELVGSYQALQLANTAGMPVAFTGNTTTVRNWLLGARYTNGDFAATTGHWRGSSPWNGRTSWIGVAYSMGNHTVSTQVQSLSQANPAGSKREATVIGLGYTYSLSRRTTLYATWGRSINNATASVAVLAADVSIAPTAAGADPKATAIGVRHTF